MNNFTSFSSFNMTCNLYDAVEKQTETFRGENQKLKNFKEPGRINRHALKLKLCRTTFYSSSYYYYYSARSFCRRGASRCGNIGPLSLEKRSKCDRLQGRLPRASLFGSPRRRPMGFGWRLWPGHSETSTSFRRSHSFVDSEVRFGSPSCRKLNFLSIFSFLTEAQRFCGTFRNFVILPA